ncbi:MAG: hypothetical protein M4579_006966 [Chaenotheca gracillima]|nr:MAG: hypothetical protein M4579_006966 [Chaenotheca gracillima]
MDEKMRAVDIKNDKGPATALYINADTPKPAPKGSGALVKIKAFGLNRMDLLQREGMYPVPPQAPKTLGVEFSGTIESFGAEPERGFKVGDEVFGLAYGGKHLAEPVFSARLVMIIADGHLGAYAEYIAVSTHMLVHKPKELSWEEAAGIPETWITATQAMYLVGAFEPGKSILWHAGASSVSISGIQLAKHDSASAIYATAGTDAKTSFCVNELGATAAFNYKTQDWASEVLKATDGKGVDIVIDFVGQAYFQGNLDVVARDGIIVNLGALSGTKLPQGVDIGAFVRKRIRFEGSSLRSRDEAYQGRLRDTLVEHALPKFVDRSFKIYVEKVYPWESIVEAHQLMEKNETKGKIICRIS